MRILFLGENWYGSCARACCYALRRLGHDVIDIDSQTIFPMLRRRSSRAMLRLFGSRLLREYNELILDTTDTFKPDILLAFKASQVSVKTLKALRAQGVALYNYYPDTSAFAHGSLLTRALPEYDCVFYTKRFLDRDMRARLKLRHSEFLPHGYDPEIHRRWDLDEREHRRYAHDVGVIATYTSYKERVLENLVAARPELDLKIWGNQWAERCRSIILSKYIQGAPLVGGSYAKAIRAFKINLAIMSGVVRGASQGDETTTRTYEIPACGGFMLHERSEEVLMLFEEDREISCFGSTEELLEKIDYYLARPEEREAIARAGYARCVPAYSYDNRMRELIEWHEKNAARSPHEVVELQQIECA